MDIKDLQKWDAKIFKLVQKYKLNPYPQEFEICDHEDMISYMAYSGMPSRYNHWSFGKSFERQKTLYSYGVSGLPYEMVINTNPCLAYLMKDNSLLLQILTIAHVYGHNDFFANNFTFTSNIDASYVLETFRNHSRRVQQYIEDPTIGIDEVERVLDSAHSLSLQRRRNLAIKKLTHEEQVVEEISKAKIDRGEFSDINPKQEYLEPNIDRIPIEPESDILNFIASHNPKLAEWEKDLINIVDFEAKYFIPQIDTKIMNEGWASYWHYKIMNALHLKQGLHLEFLVNHNQVLKPIPGSLNPYHLGFMLFHYIERAENKKAGIDMKDIEPGSKEDFELTPGREAIFNIRKSDRDSSFLRRFLTEDLMQELNMFEHEKRGENRYVSKVADNQSWKDIKNTLVKSVGMGGIPIIKIEDSNHKGQRILYLKHEYDGRELELTHAKHTIAHTKKLWQADVYLETVLSSKKTIIKLDDTGKVITENIK